MSSPATLWVVATPIGNLGDLSERAQTVLAQAEVILAEDTRRTGHLLQMMHIQPRRLLSLFEHNEQARIGTVLQILGQGRQVALVSSAGTPLMSDPGYNLVRACWQAGFKVSPVPGPSAPIAALMASGLPPYPFTFLGFLPRKAGEKKKLMQQFAAVPCTLVFFERANRVPDTLSTLASILGSRSGCLAREVTKAHEEFVFFRLGPEMALPEDILGEVTVLIAPGEKAQAVTPREEVLRILRMESEQGQGAKTAVQRSLDQVQGWGKKALYALYVQEISGDKGP